MPFRYNRLEENYGSGRELDMQIRKTYSEVNPKLLYDGLRDFILKQGVILHEAKAETYASPGDSSSFVYRGILIFKIQDKSGKNEKECLRVHVVGSANTETKVMLDVNEELFPQHKVAALQSDLRFIFGSHESKSR